MHTTFGIQFKPIISSEIVGVEDQSDKVGAISFDLEPKHGYSFGMVIRKNFDKQFSLETGINVTKRNYKIGISNDTLNLNESGRFRYTIYEIPVLALMYVQLGREFYMNSAFGITANFLPSDWDSFGDNYYHFSKRKSWIVPSLQANLGFEYRTQKDGFFYFGFSYHRPFSNITEAGIQYVEGNLEKDLTYFDISGNYLTIDIRYFFHEDPEWKNKRKRK